MHYRETARDLPWRRTTDPYAIWLSETMLQQTQVKTALPYFERWMTELPDLESLCRAPQEQLLHLWSGLGYYNRATRLQLAAREIRERFPGAWPQSPEEWLRLPGVGRYTAGAVCSIAFNQATPIVDGNIDRVLSRLHGLSSPRESKAHQDRLWELAAELVHSASELHELGGRRSSDLNQALMELGAITCTPRNPDCPNCPLNSFCCGFLSGEPGRYPVAKKRPAQIKRSLHVWILQSGARFFIRQQGDGDWNSGLWQFPATVPSPDITPPQTCLFKLSHNITRHSFQIEVFHVQGSSAAEKARSLGDGHWVQWSELPAMALSGLQRKIIRRWEAECPPPLTADA